MKNRNMWEVFMESFATGDSNRAIENQEKRGQGEVAYNDVLPRKRGEAADPQLIALGFQLGEPVDDLFIRATLPTGWQKVPTDHSLWTKLVDGQGRKRGMIMYKAAFYDRDASLSLNRRFRYTDQPVGGYGAGYNRHDDREAVVMDGDDIIWRSEPIAVAGKDWAERDALIQGILVQARAWLDEHYPDWQNLLAYWD